MKPLTTLHHTWRFRRQQKQHRFAQGRLTPDEAAERLTGEGHIPLISLTVGRRSESIVSIPTDDNGHLLIVAPPGSAWHEQLGHTLALWPGAALVVDPDGKMYQRTGFQRQDNWGPVYCLPGYHLAGKAPLRIWHREAASQLHDYLMLPVTEAEKPLLARSVALFCAVGHYGAANKFNPFNLLLDVALTDMHTALAALETVPEARLYVRYFTKGQPPHQAIDDAELVQAYSLFARQLWRYQAAYDVFVIDGTREPVVPEKWVAVNGSVYLTYSTIQLADLSGLVAAMVDNLLQGHQTFGDGRQMLVILDVSLARWLHNFVELLPVASDYGLTIILTAPSLAALVALAPNGSGSALAGQFAHQLWYPPRDRQTAEHMAGRYGTHLTEGGEVAPALSPEQMMAWTDGKVLLVTRRERPYCVIGSPVRLPEDLPQRQPPLPPQIAALPRIYDGWLPEGLDLTPPTSVALVGDPPLPKDNNQADEKTAVSQSPPPEDHTSLSTPSLTGVPKTADVDGETGQAMEDQGKLGSRNHSMFR